MKKTRKSMKSNIIAFVFIMLILIVGALAGYYQFMKKQQMDKSVKTPATEKEKLLAKDLEIGYPETPTEVMKLWGRYNQCIYNSILEEEDFSSMVKQMRVLYSDELLAQNKEEEHISKLKAEIEKFKDDKKKIVSYQAETGTSVKYKTIQGKDCAYLTISYFINVKRGYSKLYQDFILVNEDGKWKILGFKLSETTQSGTSQKSDVSTR